jgi:uncharacterized membrane protein
MSTELVVATFEGDEKKAGEVMEGLKKLEADEVLHLKHVAMVAKTKDGDVKVEDVGDVDSRHGAVFGAITGGLIGLIGGPVGAVAGAVAGAATGGVTANLADHGVSDDVIHHIEQGLQPGSSAIIAYVELDGAATLIDELNNAGASVVNQPLNSASLDQ